MLQDSIRRCASKQRRYVRIVAPSEDPNVADDLRKHLFVAKPGQLGILRRPSLECVAIEAVDGDDADGLNVSCSVSTSGLAANPYSTTGSLPE